MEETYTENNNNDKGGCAATAASWSYASVDVASDGYSEMIWEPLEQLRDKVNNYGVGGAGGYISHRVSEHSYNGSEAFSDVVTLQMRDYSYLEVIVNDM